ncbi:MAG: aminopeptidase P family protein [Candidatus Pacebacteria bacterium]|nr:aminopeptidase P family protein [Candidatus Paceibacterota bacterium]
MKTKLRKDQKLSYQNKILTSEFIKEIIHIEFAKRNYFSDLILIVSCEKDSANPHKEEMGPIFANESIIIDTTPKSRTDGYYADMTRTIVKGKASTELKKMYEAVLGAQKLALGEIKDGARADLIHRKVQSHFKNRGFKTEEKNGKI